MHNPRRPAGRRFHRVQGMPTAYQAGPAKADQATGVHPDTKIAATIALILAIPIAMTLVALVVQLATYDGLWTWLPWMPPDDVL